MTREDAPSFSITEFARFYREQQRSKSAKRAYRQAMRAVWGMRLSQHVRDGWPMGRPDSITLIRIDRHAIGRFEAVLINRLCPLKNVRREEKQLQYARRGWLYPYRLLAGLETLGVAH